MAEAVFKHKVKELGYSDYFKLIESYGTSGWHTGEPPDSRSSRTCRAHGIPVHHRAQQITGSDFHKFDYIIAMDESNLLNLQHMRPRDNKSKISLFGNWRTDTKFLVIVDDPYYGGRDGFETNLHQITHFSEEFLKQEIGELN